MPLSNQALSDRAELTDLIALLYVLLDEQRYDELDAVYAQHAVLEVPAGVLTGLDEIKSMAASRAEAYGRMQHLSSDVLVEVAGDRAVLRTNHLSFHVSSGDQTQHFDAGIVHRIEAIRTAEGWRIDRLGGEVIWMANPPT